MGCSEMHFVLLRNIQTIQVNSRQCYIQKVTVNDVETHFDVKNYLETVVAEEHGIPDPEGFKTMYKSASELSDEGELCIDIPQEPNSLMVSTDSLTDAMSSPHRQCIIRIYYILSRPRGGIHFVMNDPEAYPNRNSHAYSHNQLHGARMWMPCIDHINERCTWDLKYIVGQDLVVVSTGELVGRPELNEQAKTKTYYYKTDTTVKASNICFAVGPFSIVPDPVLSDRVTYFCLPGRDVLLPSTVGIISPMFEYFESYLNVHLPFRHYKQVFVEAPYSKVEVGAGISIFSTHLLHSNDIIDQVYETRRLLAMAIVSQWFGVNVSFKSYPDSWIIFGITGYLCYLFYQKLFGNNEYKSRLLSDMEYVYNSKSPCALYHTNYVTPAELYTKYFFKKSTLIMYLIEKVVGSEGFQKILSNMVMVMEGRDNTLEFNVSTSKFLKLAKKTTSHDLKPFAERWVYGVGIPHFEVTFLFNKIHNTTDISIRQDLNRCEKVQGNILVRIYEADGSVVEESMAIDEEVQNWQFKLDRSRRLKKKKTDDSNEPMEMDNTQSDVKKDNSLSWIRIDPDLDWLRKVSLIQSEGMWINQINEDRDVIAQAEAIEGLLALSSHKETMQALFKMMTNSNLYHRVRYKAAMGIGQLTTKYNSREGLDMLISYFKENYISEETGQLKPNDFQDLASSYFMKKYILESISIIRDPQGKTPQECIQFLIEILRSNDNSRNAFSDNFYLASIINSIRNLECDIADYRLFIEQIERYLNKEKMMPCYHNVITTSCLKTLCYFQEKGYLDVDIDRFRRYSKYGNFEQVRVMAIGCLLRVGIQRYPEIVVPFVIQILEQDPSSWVKYKVVQSLLTDIPRQVYNQSNEHMELLVRSVYQLMNSEYSCYDVRLRINLIALFQHIQGHRISTFKLKPRIILPTKPSSRSKSTSRSVRRREASGSVPIATELTQSTDSIGVEKRGGLKIVIQQPQQAQEKPKLKLKIIAKRTSMG